ncbi:EAL domain-containing protein [Rheinheimera sp.]|uniref:EAL domain-containing protein n=1 Tax=Rheinheimera sp. TaxID=1869214 RepID=UPI003AF7F10A
MSKAAFPLSALRIVVLYSLFSLLWIFGSDRVLHLMVADPWLVSVLSTLKGSAFVLFSATLLYLMLTSWRKQQFYDDPVSTRMKQWRLLGLVIAFLLALPGLAVMTKMMYSSQLKSQAYADLHTINEIKKQQLEQWLAERRYDISGVAKDNAFREQLSRMAQDQDASQNIRLRLTGLIASHAFSYIRLYNQQEQLLLEIGQLPTSQQATDWSGQQPALTCFTQSQQEFCSLNWRLQLAADQQLYKLELVADASQFLFPVLQTWPVSSPTAEVLLVKSSEKEVQFLNPLRHPRARLADQFSLDQEILTAKALRQRQSGAIETQDYRGAAVLGAYAPVANTDWMLVTKVDTAEVLAPIDTLLLWLALVAGSLLLLLVLLVLFYWRELMQNHQLELQSRQLQQDKQLRAFFDLPFLGMAVLQRVHQPFLQVNQRLGDILGYSQDELLELSLWDLLAEEQLAALPMDQLREGQPLNVDVTLKHSSGRLRVIRLMIQKQQAAGQQDWILASFDDVTEKRQLYADLTRSNQQLQNSAQQLDSILNASSAVLHRIELDGLGCATTWVSANVTRVLGFEPQACLSDGWWDQQVHPDDLQQATQALQQTLEHGYYSHEYRFYAADGSLKYIRDDLRLLPPGRDGQQLVLGAMLDVTELAQSQQQQQVTVNRLQTLFNTMSEGLILYDQHAALLDCNPAAERILGRSKEQLISENQQGDQWRFIDEEGMEVPTGLLPSRLVLTTGASVRDRVLGFSTGDSVRWLSSNAEPLLEHGELKGALVTIEDISLSIHHRKELQQRARVMAQQADLASSLLQHSDWLSLLQQSLPQLGQTLEADAIYLYQNKSSELSEQLALWQQDQTYRFPRFQLGAKDNLARSYLTEHFAAGQTIAGQVELLPELIRPLWAKVGVSAIALVPVMLDGSWWGVLGVESRAADRHWNTVEMDALKMLATALGAAIKRQRFESSLRQAGAVFESTREGIMITDANNKIIQVNQSLLRMLGYQEDEVLGQSPAMFASGRHDAEFYQQMWRELQDKGYWQGEVWNRRKNGEVYPELLSISTIRDTQQALSHYVAVFADITQLKASEQELEYLAHHDVLTGLPNRLLMNSRLQNAVQQATRDQQQFAVLMLDLDRFKYINDSFGHTSGDDLLKLVSSTLSQRLRSTDTVARFGGDEFIILLERLNQAEDAARFASELIQLLSQPWVLGNDVEVRIGASIGISLFPDHGSDGAMLISHADAALYRAKEQGRGRFAYYSDDLTRYARERIDLEGRLAAALKAGQFRVYYQPQVELSTGQIVGAEALIRWQDPVEGLIPPGRFIPIAEDTGLIGPIGDWVLAETCRQGAQWLDAGLAPVKLAVNLSSHQFTQGNISERTAEILQQSGFPAELLELELTESAIMERELEASVLLTGLHQMGVNLAIDDFGTGYSSFAYLQRYRLDVLKIDKSFMDDVEFNPESRAIVSAIISMAHIMGLKALAEGVERASQVEFLLEQGCDYYQGYFCSKPVPAAEFAALLAAAKTEQPA